MASSTFIITFVFLTILNNAYKNQVDCFDLISTLLSQTSSLHGKFPDLKKFISPQLLHKLLPGGINGTDALSLETLRKDPVQIQRLIEKLKPMQGRFDPHLFDILSNAFKLSPSPSAPPHRLVPRIRPTHSPPQQIPQAQNFQNIPPHQSVKKKQTPAFQAHTTNTMPIPFTNIEQTISSTTSHSYPVQPNQHETTQHVREIRSTTPGRLQNIQPSFYQEPIKVSRHDPHKFSSTFVRRRNKNSASNNNYKSNKYNSNTPQQIDPTIVLNIDNATTTGAPAPFNHITDPNIKNHRLYQFNNNNKNRNKTSRIKTEIEKRFENYTIIDQAEDLMMDESEQPSPSIVPLTSSDSSSEMVPEQTNGGWIPKPHGTISSQTTNKKNLNIAEDDDDRPREPLLTNLPDDNVDQMLDDRNRNPEDSISTNNNNNYFRPSPLDDELSSPEFFTPGQDFFTSTLRTGKGAGGIGINAIATSKKPFVMPQFPSKNNRKSIHQQQKLNYDQNFRNQFIHRNGVAYNSQGGAGQQQQSHPGGIIPIQNPSFGHEHVSQSHQFPPPQPGSEYNLMHPQQFIPGGMPMMQYYNNKNKLNEHNYGNNNNNNDNNLEETAENILLQSIASDKNDASSWTSTFFLLGGLVAASALAAFILPSFLTTVTTAGKDNDDGLSSSDNSNQNQNIWAEIKGLYNDLRHIANGDLSYFQQSEHETKNKDKVKNEGVEIHKIGSGIKNKASTLAPENENVLEDDADKSQSHSFESIELIPTTEWTVILNNDKNEQEQSHEMEEFKFDDELNNNSRREDSINPDEQEIDENSTSTSSNQSTEEDDTDSTISVYEEISTRRNNRKHHDDGNDDNYSIIKPTNATFFINNTQFNHITNRPSNDTNNTFLKEWARVQLKLLDQ